MELPGLQPTRPLRVSLQGTSRWLADTPRCQGQHLSSTGTLQTPPRHLVIGCFSVSSQSCGHREGLSRFRAALSISGRKGTWACSEQVRRAGHPGLAPALRVGLRARR